MPIHQCHEAAWGGVLQGLWQVSRRGLGNLLTGIACKCTRSVESWRDMLKILPAALSLCAALALTGCDSAVSSKAGPVRAGDRDMARTALAYDIRAVEVEVPPSLRVSQSNSFYPGGDIVWREDPAGDRHAQVRAIVQEAARQAFDPAPGRQRAVVHIRLRYFHALTERARATTGGWHNVNFVLSVTDAESGAMLVAPHMVRTQIQAFGGAKARDAVQRGETQKRRITRHLVEVLRADLAAPAQG